MARTVVVIAHGSSHPGVAAEHIAFCESLTRRLGESVDESCRTRIRPAFLSTNKPSLPEVIDDAAASGDGAITVVPWFLSSGNHVQVDIPDLIAAARQRHPDIDIELTSHVGEDPRLAAIALDLAGRGH